MLNLLGLRFHLYGLLIGLGIWVAVELSSWLARKRKIEIKQMGWWVILTGILGARIYHVIDLWVRYYSLQPIKVFYIWEGGLAIWGAIIGGLIGLFFYWLIGIKTKVKLRDLLDITLIGLPLAQAIGRWGNYFNGELIGKNGEPLFLYESVLNLLLFGILIKIESTPLSQSDFPSNLEEKTGGKQSGKIAGIYLIGYGLIRFLLEPMRESEIVWKVVQIPVAQIFSITAIIAGMLLMINRTRPQSKL